MLSITTSIRGIMAPPTNRPPRWYLPQWRKHRRLSQEKFGALIGVTQGAVSQYETGEVSPNMEQLEQFADALNITVRDLLFRHPGSSSDDYVEVYESLRPRDQRTVMNLAVSLKRSDED